MAHEGQHQSPLELITQNVRGILADVLNKLECGDVDRSIDFARYRVKWLCSLLVRLGGSLEETYCLSYKRPSNYLPFLTGTIILTVQVMHLQ